MLNTVWAVVREGKIDLLEHVHLPEGGQVLVTFLSGEDASFWSRTSQVSLGNIWDNTEDDVYARLLEK